MSNARSFTPVPKNEPVFSYAPGSKEKAELKKALDQLKSKVTEVPLYINGQEIMTDSKDTVVCPHNHAHVLAKVSQASSEHAAMAVTSALEAVRILGSSTLKSTFLHSLKPPNPH